MVSVVKASTVLLLTGEPWMESKQEIILIDTEMGHGRHTDNFIGKCDNRCADQDILMMTTKL